MTGRIGSKLLNRLRKMIPYSNLTTPHANIASFTQLNGSTKLFNGEWRDIIINGSSSLGRLGFKTNFEGVIVANGITTVNNASFNSLEINGNANLKNALIKDTLHINGSAELNGCTISRLIVYGKRTKVEIKDSTIRFQEIIEST